MKIANGEYRESDYLTIDFDPSKYKTCAGAAKAFYKALCKLAKELGQDPDVEVTLQTPEKSAEWGTGRNWRVIWEAGPYEWAIATSLGDLFNREAGWFTEPYYSFDVCFTD